MTYLYSKRVYFLAASLAVGSMTMSCGGSSGGSKDGSGNPRSAIGTVSAGKILAMQVPKAEPIVDATTPNGLASAASALRLTGEIDCWQMYGEQPYERRLCELRNDLLTTVLNPSAPDSLKGLAARADERIVEMYDRAGAGYISCLDENHQGGMELDVDQTTPAYQSVELDGVHEFSDGSSFDLEFPHTVSCYENHEDQLAVMIGRKEGTYYNRNTTASGGGFVSSIDAKDNIKLWTTFGERIELPSGGIEDLDTDSPNQTYTGTTMLLNFHAYPERQIMEVSIISAKDCGWRVIANDEAMLFHGNLNLLGYCYDDDTHVDTGSESFVEAFADVLACYNISSPDIELMDDQQLCEENGLTQDSFTVRRLERRDFRVYHAGHVIIGMENPGINTFTVVPLENLDNLDELLGEEESVARIFLRQGAEDGQNEASISAACNATDSSSEQFSVSFNYSLSNVFEEMISGAEDEPDFDEVQLFEMFNRGIANNSERFAVVVTGGRTLGPNYRGSFTAKATIAIDGTEVGSVDLNTPDGTTETISTDVIRIEAANLSPDQEVTVTYSGEIRLECDNENSTVRRARFVGGIPRLQIPMVPLE